MSSVPLEQNVLLFELLKVKVAQSWVVSYSLQSHGLIQSMEFSTTEYWSGYPFPSPGDLPNPGIEPGSPALQVDFALPPSEPPGKPIKPERKRGKNRLSSAACPRRCPCGLVEC